MGHNSVVSGHPKSTRIQRVDGLSIELLDLRCHKRGYRILEFYLSFREDEHLTFEHVASSQCSVGNWPTMRISHISNSGYFLSH